jgi:hypothetical protein
MPVAAEIFAVLPLGDVDATRAAADDDTEVRRRPIESGVTHRLPGRENGDARDLGIASGIGMRPAVFVQQSGAGCGPVIERDLGNAGDDLTGQRGRIEIGDGAGATDAARDLPPEEIATHAVG